jgi:hypothetical protein
MTPAITIYLLLTVTLAAAIALHTAQVLAIVREQGLRPAQAWKVLPGVASAVVWRDGGRALPIAFVLSVVAYAVLWTARAA